MHLNVEFTQHESLFKMINAVDACMEAGIYPETISQMIIQIRIQAKEHFEQEEQLLKKMGFSEFEYHKKLHDSLLTQLGEYIEDIKNAMAGGSRFSDFLSSWLISHILTEDLKYA